MSSFSARRTSSAMSSQDSPPRRADIEAIRLAWKQATHHQSVLWSRQPAEVSF